MEIKLERVTKLTIVPTGNIMLDFDSNTRRIFTPDDLKDKINNLIGALETVKRIVNQSQSQGQAKSQAQIQNRININNTLNDIESSVKHARRLLGL